MANVRITLRDVAEHVGVHPSTVSRVLNSERRNMVSTEVVQRVTKAACELGYRPNWSALKLRTDRSDMIGVVVTDITNPVILPTIRGAEDALMEAGFVSIICGSDFWNGRIHQVIDMMLSCRFDGMLMAYNAADDPILEICRRQDIPVTRMARNVAPPKTSAVILNDTLGVRWVVDHLVSLGHRRIALISGGQHFSSGRERHRSVLTAISERGLTIDPGLIAFSEGYSQEDGRRCCEELLDRGRPFTAIVAVNDVSAFGCYEALAARGLRIPEDVSVTGYNDIRYANVVSPGLTTVNCRLYEAGWTMARMLVDRIRRPGAAGWHKIMQPELVIRGSTGPARRTL